MKCMTVYSFVLNGHVLCLEGASLLAQMVKSLTAEQETQVRTLGWDDPLEEGMTTHSSILAWRVPWTEEPLCPRDPQRVGHD